MADSLYRLRILGVMPEVADREAVRESIALLFKTTPEKVDALLQRPTVLRKLFSRKAAEHLYATLLHVGVACEVEPAVPEVVQTPLRAVPSQQEDMPPATAEASALAANGKPVVPLAMEPLTVLRPVVELPAEPDDADWRAFIGANADYYLARHRRMRAVHHQSSWMRLVAYWHWPAFFFPPLWFWYRKLYLWALLSLPSLLLIGVANVLWGSMANWLYYQHGRTKIRQMRSYFPEDDLGDSLAEVGGTLNWQEALPQAVGVGLGAVLLAWLLVPVTPEMPPTVGADTDTAVYVPAKPIEIKWVSANDRPRYVYQPPRVADRPVARIKPYADMRGVTQTQIEKQPQTPEAQTAKRMSDFKRKLNSFLSESSRNIPIPQDIAVVQAVVKLESQVDGWGQPWHYQALEYGYRLTSAGADKRLGTEDDIWLEAQPRMPTFMRREAELAAAAAAEHSEVKSLRVAPED